MIGVVRVDLLSLFIKMILDIPSTQSSEALCGQEVKV